MTNFRWWHALIAYVAFLLAFILNTIFMSSTEELFEHANFNAGSLFNVLMFVLAGILCLLALRLLSRNQLTRDEFGIHVNGIFVAIVVGSVLGLLFWGLSEFIEARNQTLKDAGEQVMQEFNLGKNLVNDLLLIVGVGLFAPVVEEIVFRGAIFNAIAQGLTRYATLSRWLCFVLALAVSTVAFVSIHGGGGQDDQLLLLGVLGAFAATAMSVTRSLFAAIFVHAVNNNVVLIHTVSQQSNLSNGHSTVLIIASVMCLLLCVPLGLMFGRILPKR